LVDDARPADPRGERVATNITHLRGRHRLPDFGYNPVMLDLAAPPAGLAARALGTADLGGCVALAAEAGWNQTERDWALMLEIGMGAGLLETERLVATAVALPYDAAAPHGRRIGFVSMVLVTPAWRRRGLATWLTERCARALEQLRRVPVLDATPAGQGVYRKLGFADGIALDRWRAERVTPCAAIERVPLPDGIVLAAVTDVAALVAADAHAFGAGRPRVLQDLHARRPDLAWAALRGPGEIGAAAGFVLGREGRTASHIGPVVATDAAIATALLAQALRHVRGAAIVDLPRSSAMLAALLEAAGFAAVRTFTRMHRSPSGRGDAAASATWFAAIGPEFG
jgi:GNAT superfamily N-acetyltransferase